MIPSFPVFKNLELSDKEEIENTTKQYPPYSDYHFTQMWVWDLHEPTQLSKLNDNLVIRHSDALTGDSFFSFLGSNSINDTARNIFKYLKSFGHKETIRWIPEEIASKLNNLAFSVLEDRDNRDYVLDISELLTAVGRSNRNFRWLINSFEKSHSNLIICPLDLTDNLVQSQIKKLLQTWGKSINPEKTVSDTIFYHKALKKLLSFASEFKSIHSLGIFERDELIAFGIFEATNQDYAIFSFLLANRNYKGSFQYIIKMALEILHKMGVKYLNIEPDFGISTWRNYKSSYNPVLFLNKYTIEIKNEEVFHTI